MCESSCLCAWSWSWPDFRVYDTYFNRGYLHRVGGAVSSPHFGRRPVRGAGHVHVRVVVAGRGTGPRTAGRPLQTPRPLGPRRPVPAGRRPVRGDRVLRQSPLAVFACVKLSVSRTILENVKKLKTAVDYTHKSYFSTNTMSS